MLKQKLEALSQNKIMQHIIAFFDGYIYPAVYAVLALICSFTGLEIAFYAITLAICVFCALFGKDSKPFLPIFIIVVYSTSRIHTPQYNINSDFFYTPSVLIYIAVMLALALACIVFRMAVWCNGKNFFKDSRMRTGIILMCLAFILNGVFYSGYTAKNLLLGVLMAISFFGIYLFFFHTIETGEYLVKYVAYLLVLAGGIILIQLAQLYLFVDIKNADGSINKDFIILGWGMSNNIGAMLAFFMPACFYLALKVKRGGWSLYVLGFVFFGAVVLTLSRTSVLVGGLILACAFVFFCIKKSPVRRFAWIFNGAIAAVAIVVLAVGWSYFRQLFAVYISRGLSDMGRFDIWRTGLTDFTEAPVLGVGFYGSEDFTYYIENWYFPSMYHNIFIQMLASCGLLGIIALLIHFVQIVFCISRKPTIDTIFCLMVPVAILAACMLDNHIFHIFPAFIYSVFLLLIEADGKENPLWRGIKRRKKESVK